eukprot:775896-Rhodomonas_salina.3
MMIVKKKQNKMRSGTHLASHRADEVDAEESDGNDTRPGGDGAVLRGKEPLGPLLDGVRHHPHLRRACVAVQDPTA